MIGLDNPLHVALLLVVLLLIFGAKRLPELGRSLGHGIRGFKESISGEVKEPSADWSAINAEPHATSAASAAVQAAPAGPTSLTRAGAEPPSATEDAPSARAA